MDFSVITPTEESLVLVTDDRGRVVDVFPTPLSSLPEHKRIELDDEE
jgi:hypothetical protein